MKNKTLLWVLPYCLLASVCFGAEAESGEDVVINGRFDHGIEHWKGLTRESSEEPAQVLLSHVEDDGADSSRGCLKVSISKVTKSDTPWSTGAYVAFEHKVPPETAMKIRFDARSLRAAARMSDDLAGLKIGSQKVIFGHWRGEDF